MTDLFEEVKSRLDIVSFISQFVKLKKVGRNYVGLCPFHSERTPSFTVSPEKQIFKCFGCGVSGDVITFYMKYKGLEFKEALLELAERVGIKIDKRYFTEKKVEKDLVELNYKVAKFYQNFLWNHPQGERARAYLKERGLSEETARSFYLGYAPIEGRVLAGYLRSVLDQPEKALLLGLLKKGEDGSFLDLFRDRLMFPIFNEKGECVGFGGRALSPEAEPKYLNSPETKIFKKGEILYGLFQSKDYIKKEASVFIVEGYFDLLTLWDRGIKNVVATCGTALTREHVQKLKPLVEEWYILYDGDEAGKKAALRALSLILKEGSLPKVCLLPEGEDPDSFARKFNNPAELITTLKALSLDGIKFLWKYYEEEYYRSPRKVFNEICELLKGIEDPFILRTVTKDLAFYFHLPEHEIEKRIRGDVCEIQELCPKEEINREDCYMRIIAQYLVNYPEDYPLLEKAGLKSLLEEPKDRPYHLFLKKYMELRKQGIFSLYEIPDPFIQEIVSDLLFAPPFEDKESVLRDILRFIRFEVKSRELKKIVENLKELEKSGKKEEIEGYLFLLKKNLNQKEVLE